MKPVKITGAYSSFDGIEAEYYNDDLKLNMTNNAAYVMFYIEQQISRQL